MLGGNFGSDALSSTLLEHVRSGSPDLLPVEERGKEIEGWDYILLTIHQDHHLDMRLT